VTAASCSDFKIFGLALPIQLRPKPQRIVGHFHLLQIELPNRGIHRLGDWEALAIVHPRPLVVITLQEHDLPAILYSLDQSDALWLWGNGSHYAGMLLHQAAMPGSEFRHQPTCHAFGIEQIKTVGAPHLDAITDTQGEQMLFIEETHNVLLLFGVIHAHFSFGWYK
jgi:hypothetical protein